MIQPSEPYIALSKDKLSFSHFKNLDTCKNIVDKTYLCEIVNIYSVPGNPSCEVELISKSVSKLPDSCQYHILHGHIDIWHKLQNENWIFVQTEPCKLSIECKMNITETIILGTGILDLLPGCVAYHRNYRIVKKSLPHVNIPILTPRFNILNDSCCNYNKIKDYNLHKLELRNINLDSIRNFVNTNQNLIYELNSIKPLNYVNIGFPIISVILITLCISIIIYFCKRGHCSEKLFKSSDKIITNENHENVVDPPQLRIG